MFCFQTDPTTWTDCGGSVATVNSFSVLPNPLSLPGDVSLAADLDISEELSSPVKVCIYLVVNLDRSE